LKDAPARADDPVAEGRVHRCPVVVETHVAPVPARTQRNQCVSRLASAGPELASTAQQLFTGLAVVLATLARLRSDCTLRPARCSPTPSLRDRRNPVTPGGDVELTHDGAGRIPFLLGLK
jgi:hypothetical protein